MAIFNYHNPFKVGQTVTVTATGVHGLVVATYVYQGRARVSVRYSLNVPTSTFEVTELRPYSVQPCDHVIVRDSDGILWPLEVLDLKLDCSAVLFKRPNGVLDWCPMEFVISVIPMENIAKKVEVQS